MRQPRASGATVKLTVISVPVRTLQPAHQLAPAFVTLKSDVQTPAATSLGPRWLAVGMPHRNDQRLGRLLAEGAIPNRWPGTRMDANGLLHTG